MAADSSKPWEDFAPASKSPSGGQSEKPWEDFGGESKPEPKGFAGHARDLGISALQGAIGVPEMAVGLADIPTGGAVGKFLENKDGAVGFRPKQAREFLDTLKTDATQQQKKEFEQADGVMGKAGYALSNPSLISNAVAESLPVMGAGGLIGRGVMAAAPKLGAAVAAGAGEGIASAGSTAEQIRQETKGGELTAGQSALALGAGAATGAFGVAGAKAAKKLGIADADTLMVQGSKGMAADATQQAAMKSIPRKVIEGAIAEGFLEELPQSASEQIIQNIALDRPWSDGVESSVVMGVLSGMAMGGGATLVQGSAQRKTADGAPAGEQNAPQDAPTLALPAPTYTGTPNDQMLQAEAERANAVAEAEARAAGIYQQRADFEAAQQGQPEQPPVNAGLELVRQAYAAQLDALQQQEQGQPPVPQSAPPDGRAALEAQAAQAQAQREADRAVTGPDDEILQSTGAAEPPHRAMGIDPAAGPLSAGAAIAVDTGVAGQMAAAAQAVTAQDAAPQQAAGPLTGSPLVGAALQDPAAAWNSMSMPERAAVAGRVGLPPVVANNIPRTGWEGLNSDLQARISKAMAPAAPATAPSIEGADLGNGWAKFSAESGTAGVPRAEMPQIKAEHRGAMVNFMNARGVSHTAEEVSADSLRPTQAEFSPEKVRRAAGFKGGDRSILVSADNYVLDGHHQWLASRESGEPVKVIRLNAPIADLIPLAREFPSSTLSKGSKDGQTADPQDNARLAAQGGAQGRADVDGGAGDLVQRSDGAAGAGMGAASAGPVRGGAPVEPAGTAGDGRGAVGQALQILMDRTNGIGAPDGLSGPEHADARTAIVSALTGESVADIEAAPNFKFRTSVPQMERLLYDAAGIPAGKTLGDRRTPFMDWLDQRESGGAPASTELSSRADALDREMARKLQEADGGGVMSAAANQEPIKNETRTNAGPAPAERDSDQEPIKNAEPSPLDFTPKQYHEARMKWVAQEYGLSNAEVRHDYDTDAARKADDDAWVAAVRQAFKEGRDVPRSTLDKLEELRPGAFGSFLHDYPDAKVPAGYQTPVARKAENEAADDKRADRRKAAEQRAADSPAVGNAPSPLEALFSDLNSDSTRKANKAKKAAAKLPEAARIEYVQANFHDILMQMMEAGALEVNGFATLTEDNAPCL